MKQKANGSWTLEEAAAFCSTQAAKLRDAIPASMKEPNAVKPGVAVDRLWATLVVAAYLTTQFGDQKVNWDLVVKKALKYAAKCAAVPQPSDGGNGGWYDLATNFVTKVLLAK